MNRAAAVLALAACGDAAPKLDSGVVSDAPALSCTETRGTTVSMRLVATTNGPALLATSPPGDPRVFVVEQQGRIRVLTDDRLSATPFLDLSDDIACCGEQGLLGLAFHPSYATNGLFFVYYTTESQNIVARYQVSTADPDRADKASGTIVLAIDDFASNHNGGMIELGPDGYLYIATGDGGGGGDPRAHGQNPATLLGKMLRIDIDNPAEGKPYGIPPGNPYAAGGGAPEVFMIGMRNPWRWSFDRMTGDMWIGDVGQNEIEELNHLTPDRQAGANLGWKMYEGSRCYDGPCDPTSKVTPVYERPQSQGWCSIIGGQVYRGSCYPDLAGTYFFTDYCAHELVTAKPGAGGLVFESLGTDFPATPSSLHADSRGELYLTTTQCCGTQLLGGVYHLEAGP